MVIFYDYAFVAQLPYKEYHGCEKRNNAKQAEDGEKKEAR